MKKGKTKLSNVKCEVCGYSNHKQYVLYNGLCHGCGNILDDRIYFRYKMNRKLKIWKDNMPDKYGERKNRFCNRKIGTIEIDNGISRQNQEKEKICEQNVSI